MATKTSAQKQKEIEEYWARRNRELEAEWHRKCQQEIEKELAAYYRQVLRHIDDDIAKLYARFADQNGLDMVAAQRMLQGDEFRVWRMDISEYVQQIAKTGDKELLRELNVLAMRSRITRLDKLRGDTLVELSKLSTKVEKVISKVLPSAYKDFYYHGLYEIGKKAQIAVPVAKLDKEKLENVTRIPWSGKNYSERIWHNNAKLGQTIQQTMVTAMHRGSSLRDLSRYVADRMNVGIHDAERLVQTELNYVQNKAALDSIKDVGMKYYRFIATLDSRTTVICREHDGRTFAVDDADVGYNMPPLHPRCRSTISGCLRALKDKPLGERIARNSDTGKTYHVPAGMKYEEWYRTYVEKSSQTQYYRAVLYDQGDKANAKRGEMALRMTRVDAYNPIYVSENVELKPRQLHEINLRLTEAQRALGIEDVANLPVVYIISTEEMQTDALAAYNRASNILYLDARLGIRKQVAKLQKAFGNNSDPLSTFVHEYLHWKDAEDYRQAHGGVLDARYMPLLLAKCKKAVVELLRSGYNINDLGEYASKSLMQRQYDEVYTEYRTYELLKRTRR